MVEVATINRNVQIGAETTPGVAVAALKRLAGLGLQFAPAGSVSPKRPMGSKYNTGVVIGREHSESDVSGIANYEELPYQLCSLLGKTTPTIPGGGTNSREWLFNMFGRRVDDPQTYTVEMGDVLTTAYRVTNAVFDAMNIDVSADDVGFGGHAIAGRCTYTGVQLSTNEKQQIAITGAPTGGTFTITFTKPATLGGGTVTTAAIPYNAAASAVQTAVDAALGAGNSLVTGGPLPGTPVVIEYRGTWAQQDITALTTSNSFTGGTTPNTTITTPTAGVAPTGNPLQALQPTEFSVWLDPTFGALGTTQLLRVFNCNWSLGSKYGPVNPINRALTSFAGIVDTEPAAEMQLTVEADSAGQALMDSFFRTGATQFLRLQAVGPVIEGALNYELKIDAAVKPRDVPTNEDANGAAAYGYPLVIVDDGGWGRAAQLLVRNQLAAL